jgi:hypothetical protein
MRVSIEPGFRPVAPVVSSRKSRGNNPQSKFSATWIVANGGGAESLANPAFSYSGHSFPVASQVVSRRPPMVQ